jgi:drug/metabolite transporter (DMT)-like permease
MLRGFIIIVTAVMSIVFLKRKLYRHHWSSVAVIFTGVALVGLAAVLAGNSGDEEVNPLGIFLLVLSQLFIGGLFIVEEKLLGDYYLDPLKVVGLEGLWGLIITVILLPIFQVIECGPNELCYYGRLEDTTRAFADMRENWILILQSILIAFSIGSFNAFGVSVTKNASAAQRSTIDTSRTVLIWIFFLAFKIPGVKQETFSWLQLFGFILLVLGTLVYNEIIVLHTWGFDKNTKAALAKKQSHATSLLDSNDNGTDEGAANYVAVSPHAHYDASRNKRNVQ